MSVIIDPNLSIMIEIRNDINIFIKENLNKGYVFSPIELVTNFINTHRNKIVSLCSIYGKDNKYHGYISTQILLYLQYEFGNENNLALYKDIVDLRDKLCNILYNVEKSNMSIQSNITEVLIHFDLYVAKVKQLDALTPGSAICEPLNKYWTSIINTRNNVSESKSNTSLFLMHNIFHNAHYSLMSRFHNKIRATHNNQFPYLTNIIILEDKNHE